LLKPLWKQIVETAAACLEACTLWQAGSLHVRREPYVVLQLCVETLLSWCVVLGMCWSCCQHVIASHVSALFCKRLADMTKKAISSLLRL
jgi:hypothetical protein